ncbi:MAG TPA: glucose-1-phosphate adenylyltransferase [Erysipelotrichaceae bacterium]|nr:glucose-1-phosphate adenylyltransferase [Erysipelotrichaceae bacterium]
MLKPTTLAMILAGGRVDELNVLTYYRPKSALPFGGFGRVIDFPLSNLMNSGIEQVAILSQYRSYSLNNHIGTGAAWDMLGRYRGISMLPPYIGSEQENWYRGSADAVFRNLDFVQYHDPEQVLVLSGDHIYKMDYDKMLSDHKKNNADITIAVLEVPLKEASRFGIMNADETGRIVEFEEKPKQPKSNLASMGVYIFNWKLLRKMLVDDVKAEKSSHDFGKDIIPGALNSGKRLFTHRFKGYWKDVGTIDSLWEANMDLIYRGSELDLSDPAWKIYTEDITLPSQYIGRNATVKNAYINQGCIVDGHVENSVLFTSCVVEEGAKVIDSVLMPGAIVRKGALVQRVIVADEVEIKENAKVGKPGDGEIELIHRNVHA